jgi:hypothetical protein
MKSWNRVTNLRLSTAPNIVHDTSESFVQALFQQRRSDHTVRPRNAVFVEGEWSGLHALEMGSDACPHS